MSFEQIEKFQCLKSSTTQGLSHGTIRTPVAHVQKCVSKFVKLKLDFLLKFPGKYLGNNSPDLPTYRTNLFHQQTRCNAPNLMQMALGACELWWPVLYFWVSTSAWRTNQRQRSPTNMRLKASEFRERELQCIGRKSLLAHGTFHSLDSKKKWPSLPDWWPQWVETILNFF